MDINLPDGTVVKGVPDGTTKAQFIEKAKANGHPVPKEWESASPQQAAPTQPQSQQPKQNIGNIGTTFGEPIAQMVTGALAAPISNIAGLAATGYEALTGNQNTGMPAQFKNHVQEQLTYHPRTAGGQAVSNALNYIPEQYGKVVNAVRAPEGTADTKLGTARNMLAAGMEQAPNFIGMKQKPLTLAEGARIKGTGEGGQVLPKDVIRAQSQEVGLHTGAEKGLVKATAESVGLAKMFKQDSKHNQKVGTQLAAQDIGLPKNSPLTEGVLMAKKQEQWKVYEETVDSLKKAAKEIKVSPDKPINSSILGPDGKPIQIGAKQGKIKNGIASTPEYEASLNEVLNDINSKLEEDSATYHNLAPAAQFLKEQLAIKVHNPAMILDRISQLRKDAKREFQSATVNNTNGAAEMAQAHLGVANQLEGLLESALPQGSAQLAKFQSARKQLAKINAIEHASNPATGEINLTQLGKMADKQKFDGNLKILADHFKAFPATAQNLLHEPATLSVFDTLFGAVGIGAGHAGTAAALIGSRLAAPAMSRAGIMQNRSQLTSGAIPPKPARPLPTAMGAGFSQSVQGQDNQQ